MSINLNCLSALVFSIVLLPASSIATEATSEAGQHTSGSAIHFSDAEKQRISLHGPWPVPPPPDPGNELSGLAWAEKLGEQLFFNPGLSANGEISCGTCHQPDKGFSDGRNVAIGEQQHVRNTQGLWNIGLQAWFGWDGGADSLWAATLRPLMSDIEMGSNVSGVAVVLRDSVSTMTALESGLPGIDLKTVSDDELVVLAAKSIAAFMRSLTSQPTEFDVFREALSSNDSNALANYPDEAKRGLKIFIGEGNCQVCHFGPNFSNGEFHDTGRPFFTGVGKVDPGRYSGIKRVRHDKYNLLGTYNSSKLESDMRKTSSVKLYQGNFGQWRTPSLRELSSTAPYMHDGSLVDLRAVVDAYADIDTTRLHAQGETILKPLDLSDRQRQDLVRFLETLSR